MQFTEKSCWNAHQTACRLMINQNAEVSFSECSGNPHQLSLSTFFVNICWFNTNKYKVKEIKCIHVNIWKSILLNYMYREPSWGSFFLPTPKLNTSHHSPLFDIMPYLWHTKYRIVSPLRTVLLCLDAHRINLVK